MESDMTELQWSPENIHFYNCSSCKAEFLCNLNLSATTCPYCGKQEMVSADFKACRQPEHVIPFKISRETAVETIKKHFQSKRFLPKIFSEPENIEKIQAVYVPFWIYSGEAEVQMSFTGERNHERNVSSQSVVTIAHFKIDRKGSVPFSNVPVDASERMDDSLMDSLEPYDFTEAVDFLPEHLNGVYAENYDVSPQECEERLKKRIEISSKDTIKATVEGYGNVKSTSENVEFTRIQSTYGFLPVWLLNTEYKGQNYQIAINGQTGKLTGNLPVDKSVYAKYFSSIAALTAIIVGSLIYLLTKGGGF